MTETIDSASAAASTLFLGHNGEWWDSWLIVSVIVAALVATAIGVTTAGSIISHKREAAAAEDSLSRYKSNTGKEIGEANVRAAAATQKAAEAQLALEKYKAPRNLTSEQSEKLIADLGPLGPVTYDIAYPAMMEPGSFLVQQLIRVFTTLNWRFVSYEGPLPKQELPLTAVKKLPPEMFAEWPQKTFLAGTTSQLIGIKILDEFNSGNTGQWIKLSTDLLEFGMFAVPDSLPHQYDEHGRKLPTSDVFHILIGSKQ